METISDFLSQYWNVMLPWILFMGSEIAGAYPSLKDKALVKIIWSALKRLAAMRGTKMFLVLALSFMLGGCGFFAPGAFEKPEACSDGAKSAILSIWNNPTGVSTELLIVQAAALETLDNYGREEATKILDEIDNFIIQVDITYLQLVSHVASKIEIAERRIGVVLFILGKDIEKLQTPLPISECDKALIRAHLLKQRQLIMFY